MKISVQLLDWGGICSYNESEIVCLYVCCVKIKMKKYLLFNFDEYDGEIKYLTCKDGQYLSVCEFII